MATLCTHQVDKKINPIKPLLADAVTKSSAKVGGEEEERTQDEDSISRWKENVLRKSKDIVLERELEGKACAESDKEDSISLKSNFFFSSLTAGTSETKTVSRRSYVNAKVRWLMYQTIQPQLDSPDLVAAAHWILCHCHKQLPYDRNWWSRIERQNRGLSMKNADIARQVQILNRTLYDFAHQLVSASDAVKKYIDGIDPVTNTLRKRDWNASTSLSEWISGDRGLLIKKLANNDPDVRHIKPYLPECLCEKNLREALHNGGILIYAEPHHSAAIDMAHGRVRRSSNTETAKYYPRHTPGCGRRARYSAGCISFPVDDISDTADEQSHHRYQQQLNLVRPGAADTRMLDITLMDGAVLPVRRSRCSLGIPPAFVTDPVVVPKICVYDFNNGLHLYIFYRGHKMGKRKRSRYLLSTSPTEFPVTSPTLTPSAALAGEASSEATTPTPFLKELTNSALTEDDECRNTCCATGIPTTPSPLPMFKSLHRDELGTRAWATPPPPTPRSVSRKRAAEQREELWQETSDAKRFCGGECSDAEAATKHNEAGNQQAYNALTVLGSPSAEHVEITLTQSRQTAVTNSVSPTALSTVVGLPCTALKRLLPGFTVPTAEKQKLNAQQPNCTLEPSVPCFLKTATTGGSSSTLLSSDVFQRPSGALCPQVQMSGVSAISRNVEPVRCHRTNNWRQDAQHPALRYTKQQNSQSVGSLKKTHAFDTNKLFDAAQLLTLPGLRKPLTQKIVDGRCVNSAPSTWQSDLPAVFFSNLFSKNENADAVLLPHIAIQPENQPVTVGSALRSGDTKHEEKPKRTNNVAATAEPKQKIYVKETSSELPVELTVPKPSYVPQSVSAELTSCSTTTTVPVQTVFVSPNNHCTYLFNAELILDISPTDDDKVSLPSVPNALFCNLTLPCSDDAGESVDASHDEKESDKNSESGLRHADWCQDFCVTTPIKKELNDDAPEAQTTTSSSTCASDHHSSVEKQSLECDREIHRDATAVVADKKDFNSKNFTSTSCCTTVPITSLESFESNSKARDRDDNASSVLQPPSPSRIATDVVGGTNAECYDGGCLDGLPRSDATDLRISEIPLRRISARLTNVTLLMMRSD